MINALILEAIRQGIPTPARQAADRLGIADRNPALPDRAGCQVQSLEGHGSPVR